MQFDFPGLGTQWWIEIWDEVSAEQAGKIFDFARLFVTEFDTAYSRFNSSSQISSLNKNRSFHDGGTSELRRILMYGVELYKTTDGVFNILTGHILEARGYDATYTLTDKGSADLHPGNPTADIIFTEQYIELIHGNVDIGGYGKGWCIDRLAEQLQAEYALEQFLINGGGDIYATHQKNQPVEIYLEDPKQPGKIIGNTHIQNQAFAASSPHKRSWPTVDGTATHIVTQTNTEIRDSVYLTAPNATIADAFATTLLQVDTETAQRLAKQNSLTIL